jgi:hypothetical protein
MNYATKLSQKMILSLKTYLKYFCVLFIIMSLRYSNTEINIKNKRFLNLSQWVTYDNITPVSPGIYFVQLLDRSYCFRISNRQIFTLGSLSYHPALPLVEHTGRHSVKGLAGWELGLVNKELQRRNKN